VVQRALRFFNREPFRYTLVPPPLGDNVADAFLFETQSGFCEHYASSFVLLMRIAGIPSRIVAGYLGGEYNPISDDYVVRQSDAHAWAEVWIDGRGWVRVDPTGAVAADRVERDGRIAGLGAAAPVRFRVDRYSGLGRVIHGARLLADALDSGWTNWVLGYSGRRQQRLLEVFGLEDLRQYGLAVLMGIATLGIMAVWSLTLARRRGPDEPVLRAWQRFCGKLSRIGLGRAPEEGPLAYVARIVSERPDLAEEVEPIVTAYVAIRYAPAADGDALARLEQRVRRFRPGRRRAYAGPEHRE